MTEPNYKKKTLSGLAWRFSERFLVQIVRLIVEIVLARILMPDDYGVVALVAVFVTISDVFITSGFGSALVQKKDSDETDFSSVFYAGTVVAALLYLLLFFAAPLVAAFYGNAIITPVLRVLGITLLVSAFQSPQQAYVNKHLLFRNFFFATLFGTVLSAAVSIVLAYQGYGVWALVAQTLTNKACDTVMLFVVTRWYPRLRFSWKRVKGLLSFGWKILLSGLLDTGYNELRSLIIGKRYTAADLAYYQKGKSFPALIGNNVDAPIQGVLFPVLSKVQDDREQVKRMTRRAMRTSCYVVFPLMAGLAVIAPTLIPFLLTDKWNAAIPYLQMMCFVYALYPLHTSNLQAIKALGRSDLFLRLEVVKKVVGLAALLISMWFGVFWIVFSSVATGVLATVINAYPNRKLLGYTWGEQMRDLLPNLGLALAMGAAVYGFNYLPIPPIAVLVIQIAVGIVVYVALSKLLRIETFGYLVATFREIFAGRKKKKAVAAPALALRPEISYEEFRRFLRHSGHSPPTEEQAAALFAQVLAAGIRLGAYSGDELLGLIYGGAADGPRRAVLAVEILCGRGALVPDLVRRLLSACAGQAESAGYAEIRGVCDAAAGAAYEAVGARLTRGGNLFVMRLTEKTEEGGPE